MVGKYIGYAILIFAILFALELFGVVDIPFLEIPDFLSGKKKFSAWGRIKENYNI